MGRASISYTNKDYESLRQELLSRIPLLTERWTDFNESDLGVVLLELFCGTADMLAYYLDAQAAEAFLPTARQRQNVINLCKLIGYKLDSPVASTTTLRFSLGSVMTDDVTIAAGIICVARLDDGDAQFETIDDAVIPRGQLWVDSAARQGARKSEQFISTGTRGQRFALSSTSVAQGSVQLRVGNSAWNEVQLFADSGCESFHYQVETDGLNGCWVVFGDSVHGAIPPANEAVEVEYLETLGASGNIARGLVTEILSPVTQNGTRIDLSVTNTTASTGGSERESLEHAKLQAPAELRSLWKAVTKDDYKALAEGFAGVAKVQVLDHNDDAGIRYYQVNMSIAPDGGGVPSPVLKSELAEFIESRKVLTIEVNLFDAIYIPVDICAELYVNPSADMNGVRSQAEAALRDFFSFTKMSFGQSVHFSDLVLVLGGVRGVSHVKMIYPTSDIDIGAGELPTLGETNLDMNRVTL